MGLLSFFPKVTAVIKDKGTEQVSITRVSRSITVSSINNISNALLQDNSVIDNGDYLEIGTEGYLVTAKRTSVINTVCQLHKVNCTVSIVRLKQEFINNQATGKYIEIPLYENIGASYVDVTANMKLFDSGLLSTSTRKFILPKLTGLKLLDRIKFGSDNCKIDDINYTNNENLLTIQTSPDIARKT